ncbi:MAG: alkaline phosphatase family protein [Chloroflexota bacterium]
MRRAFLTIGLLAVLLASCAPVATPAPPPTPTAVPATFTPFVPATATFTLTPSPTPTITPTPLPRISRVLVISVDGLRPEAVDLAPMPVLQGLMAQGAYTLHAQTVYPSATLPAHASMLTGLCPAQHGVDWNDYLPDRGRASGDSVFDLAHRAGLKTVMVFGKKKLVQVNDEDALDVLEFVNDRDSVVAERAAPLLAAGFDLALVHLPLVDLLGHGYGWLSDDQLIGAVHADEAIGLLLDALEAAGLRGDTLIIVTADHGGHDSSHGSKLPEDMTVPWVVVGPRVIPQEIPGPVNVVDTAATVLWALGLPLPQGLAGLPVTEAFGEPPTLRLPDRCP